MKVRIVANIIETDCVADPGQELDLREEVALDLISRGLALKVSEAEEKAEEKAEGKPKPAVERAVAETRETAVHPAQKK